jgi:AsmA-like protein
MPPRPRSRFWRICRIYFRRVRITVWLVLLGLSGALVYVNQIGLPDFAKRPLLEKLRARGIDLRFSRLRLRWYGGIVADNVRFERADEALSPQLSVREVQVRLNHRALAHLQFQVDALILRQGRFVWPVAQTESLARPLMVDRIQTELRFLPDDQWSLDKFTADFQDAHIYLSGIISNASAVRDWKFFQPATPTPAGLWQERLRHFADTLDQIHFSAPPDLRLDVRGDARAPESFSVRTYVNAPGADTPWGRVSQARFIAQVLPATNQELSQAEINLLAADAQTRWGATTNLHLRINLISAINKPTEVQANLTLSADQLRTPWGSATNTHFTAQWIHSFTNPVPVSAQGRLECDWAETEWGSANNFELTGRLLNPASALPAGDPSWAWWTNIAPYALDWKCSLTNLLSPKVRALSVSGAGSWRAPQLTVSNLNVKLYQGKLLGQGDLQFEGHLDVATRSLEASLASTVDPEVIAPLLTPGAQRWLAEYSWGQPPHVSGRASLTLPAWTNSQPDWRVEVQPTLQLHGQFRFDNRVTYRAIPVTTAQSHFIYSNMIWRLPDLVATRPEGRLTAAHQADDRTKEFHWQILSTFDPNFLRPVLQTNEIRGLDFFQLTRPPVVQAEIWGHFHEPERTGVKARVALTNFTFRGETVSACQTALNYTNRWLEFIGPQILRGTQQLSADGLSVDFPAQKIYLTNGFSTTEPQVVARAIGPKIGHTLEPYQFGNPPIAHAHGTIPIHRDEDADLHFDLDGGPFHWSKFHVRHIAGHVHWAGQQLSLRDVHMEFYGGTASGWAAFEFHPQRQTDYQFSLTTTNTSLHSLMADVSTQSNHLEGRLSGDLVISRANSLDWRSVQGHGDLELRDGLIWDIPLFGIFSPVLDSLVPGLGNSRANAATCTFAIVDGVIHSDDLEIHAPMLRLEYRGTIDLQKNVDAKVDAALLRDVPGLGPLMSLVLWPVTKLFEYRVTGSITEPKTEPVFLIPKVVLMPFHPLRTLKGIFSEESNDKGVFSEDFSTPATNGPPAKPPEK